MKIEWIETAITGSFTLKDQRVMVTFAAPRQDGKSWAVPKWVVERDIGHQWAAGLPVRIGIDKGRVNAVRALAGDHAGRPQAVGGPRSGTSGPSKTPGAALESRLPYGFMPIDLDRTISAAPVWHDGSSGGDLLSGEILCEMEALTPLLVANTRYPRVQVDPQTLKDWGFEHVSPKKQIAEPLMIDGRVVIPGSALKGMLRHGLGALTHAPMERVTEHHFTYRPNLDRNAHDVPVKYEVRPARVLCRTATGWEIELFPDPKSAIFVRKKAEQTVRAAASDGIIDGELKGVELERSHLIPSTGAWRLSRPHRLVKYQGGIDGEGLLAAAFEKSKHKDAKLKGRHVVLHRNGRDEHRGPFTYDLALVPQKGVCRLVIPEALYDRYLDDQVSVLADREIGHLTGHPLDAVFDVDAVEHSIKQHREFCVDQLVYVEVTVGADGKVSNSSQVVSCGHHFRYRWAYSSSVRKQNGELRACLRPIAAESDLVLVGDSGDAHPKELSGARLLFGYVRDDKTNAIGTGVFERLGGRIAINHAISGKGVQFLGSKESGFCIPLKILGQPKPSAWEFYLRQPEDDSAAMVTYGDLPGDPGGDLAGRNYYRHQIPTSEEDIRGNEEEAKSDQATLARFISKPGETFRFTLRFARLRSWELGALLGVLEPGLLAQHSDKERFAHKLGMGRPLGMGSVVIRRKAIRLRCERVCGFMAGAEADGVAEEALSHFKERCPAPSIIEWLKMYRIEEGVRLKYPRASTKKDGQWSEEIYAWNTVLRRKYSQLRRQSEPNWSEIQQVVRNAGIR